MRKLDQVALEGNIKVFCHSRPLFEDEGPSAVEFLDDLTIRVDTSDETSTNPKKDYEFDRVYGPHVGQADIFNDVQPLVQSALDGFNMSIFAYGQSNSGKTHTMEGSSHDHGLYARCFEEVFDFVNSDATATSRYDFSVTVFELHNEQVRDLVHESGRNSSKICMGSSDFFVELTQEKISSPLSKGTANMPSRTSNNNVGRTLDVIPSPLSAEKSAGSVALVKASSEKIKTRPAGEYLTADAEAKCCSELL